MAIQLASIVLIHKSHLETKVKLVINNNTLTYAYEKFQELQKKEQRKMWVEIHACNAKKGISRRRICFLSIALAIP